MKKEHDVASYTFTEKEKNVRLRERSDYVYFIVHQGYVKVESREFTNQRDISI